MNTRRWIGVLIAASLAFVSLGCEGDTGPEGPQGPEGPEGPPGPEPELTEFTYLGNFGEPCLHCHATTVENWEATNHELAYDALGSDQDNLYCLQCHTTGFDSEVQFGDTEIAPGNRGPDEFGYDDYFGVDTEEAAERRAALEGVQCEACHGPMGPDFNAHEPLISFSTHSVAGVSTSLCYKCHGRQIEEWLESGHSQAAGGDIVAFNAEHYAHIASCQPCHTSEGFIRANDPVFLTYEFGEEVSFIGCPTCHDPHVGEETEGNEFQLRSISPVEVMYTGPGLDPGDPGVPRMEGYGAAQTCAQCHHARRTTSTGESGVLNQIASGYSHFGPHGSPQMDMFIGAGSYEIAGYAYDGDHSHQATGCVKCHMVRDTLLHGETVPHPFHRFEPAVGNCLPCHTLTDFDYNGVQTAVRGKLDQIAQSLGWLDAADFGANFADASLNAAMDTRCREVAYPAMFVYEDGSFGVHNPDYANSLLDNAIQYYADEGLVAADCPTIP